MKFYKNKLLTTVTAVALALAVGACSSSSDDDNGISAAQMAAEAELAALQAAFGEDDLTPDAITALSDQITALTTQVETLMARAEITPEAVQALNDQITALLAGMPEDVQALNGQIMALTTQVATLMARADITPEAVQALREQITALMATAPTDIQALNDQITALNTQVTTLMGRADITPADLLGLRAEITALTTQVTTLMARADITPAAVQGLNDRITDLNTQITALMATAPADIQELNDQITALNTQVTNLMGRADISPADLLVLRAEVTALNTQVTTLMARADITPAAVQALRNQISSLTTQVTTLMATTPSDVRALQEVVAAFATVRTSVTDAEGAASVAKAAVKTAMESLLRITALGEGVAGDSARATANAQAILDAETDANEAVDIADAAVQSAKDALVVAKALPSDDPNRDTLIAALEDAIKAAEVHAKEAADSRGDEDGPIAKAVEDITGDDPEAEGYPMTPAQHGRAVAMKIAMALAPTSVTMGARMRGEHGTTAPVVANFPDAVMMNDHQGSTWAEIVGTVVDKRIAEGTGTKAVKAALIEGQMGTDVHLTDLANTGEYDDGVQFPGSDQNGIPGIAFCGGDDCEVDEDGELTGSWYFTPTSPTEWYVERTVEVDGGDDVTSWIPETLYARFGHWLGVVANDDAGAMVNTFAVGGANAPNTTNLAGLELGVSDDDEALMDTSASYRGPAAGMSVEKTTDMDGEITEINSAAFTATVNLKATFGPTPTLGGTVMDFRGPATDANWSVELLAQGEFDGSFVNGVTVASGQNGVWTATAYGTSGARPTGIFGGFNAHFTDGHAAGAYAAR